MPRLTVLLVDDDPDIRSIGALCLEGVGKWRALLASSGDEAIAMAHRERPDLILLDVMMPHKDGLVTLAELQAHSATASIPVIMMTAKAQPEEVEGYDRAGAIGVIIKPFDPLLLPREIRLILDAR